MIQMKPTKAAKIIDVLKEKSFFILKGDYKNGMLIIKIEAVTKKQRKI